jgi:predicted metal-dependent HD superfamily phosphohydrolase
MIQQTYRPSNQELLEQTKEFAHSEMSFGTMATLPYHNFEHVLDMTDVARRYAEMEGVSPEGSFLIQTAGYLHDVIYFVGASDNEERSAELGAGFLRSAGYNESEVGTVEGLILATKVPTEPKDLYQQILVDADVDNLGRWDFFDRTEKLRQEFGVANQVDWYKGTVKFMDGHEYYTQSAKSLRDEGFKSNLSELERRIVQSI